MFELGSLAGTMSLGNFVLEVLIQWGLDWGLGSSIL